MLKICHSSQLHNRHQRLTGFWTPGQASVLLHEFFCHSLQVQAVEGTGQEALYQQSWHWLVASLLSVGISTRETDHLLVDDMR
jgi:hypothetical protein